MKKLILATATLASTVLLANTQILADEVNTPHGYTYVGGDEFNGDRLDTSKWFAYGSQKVTPT